MRAITRIRHYISAFAGARRNRMDLVGWIGRRPWVLLAVGFYETALLLSNRVDPRLKELAELKAASLVGCEFCLDIGSALAHSSGLTERQLTDLPRYATSDAYTDEQKLVLRLAEAMSITPASPDLAELRTQLLTTMTKAQFAELAAAIAWENQRARVNQALGVRPAGMAEGMTCALPQRPE